MPRIIKANQASVSNKAQLIDVPSKNYFNPNVNRQIYIDSGFTPANYADFEDPEAEGDEGYVDPELIVQMAEEEAKRIVDAANDEADLIIQKGKLQAEEEKAGAREEGMAEGLAQGNEEARLQNEQLLAEAADTLENARIEREDIIAAIEPQMVTLIADIVEKLVGSAFVLNPQVITYIIRTGIGNVSGAPELSIRVAKDDFDLVNEMKEEILSYIDSDTAVSIVKDTSLNQGDCIIDTPIGSIDSSIDKQWASLKNDLYLLLRETTL